MKNGKQDVVEKRSVSAPEELFEKADDRMRSLMMNNFSEYVRHLMREDVQGNLATPKAQEPSKQAA